MPRGLLSADPAPQNLNLSRCTKWHCSRRWGKPDYENDLGDKGEEPKLAGRPDFLQKPPLRVQRQLMLTECPTPLRQPRLSSLTESARRLYEGDATTSLILRTSKGPSPRLDGEGQSEG